MISDAYIEFECDNRTCGDIERIVLPIVYSSMSGKDPHVDLRDSALEKLLPRDWSKHGDEVYCEDCAEERKKGL